MLLQELCHEWGQYKLRTWQDAAARRLLKSAWGIIPFSDWPHILKRLMAVIQGQDPAGDPDSQLNMAQLEAACMRLHETYMASSPAQQRDLYCVPPSFLLRAIREEIDDQNVPAVAAFFGCSQLWEQLKQDGHGALAWLVQAIWEAFCAFDESGGWAVFLQLRVQQRPCDSCKCYSAIAHTAQGMLCQTASLVGTSMFVAKHALIRASRYINRVTPLLPVQGSPARSAPGGSMRFMFGPPA